MEKKRVGLVGLGAIAGMKWGDPGDARPYNHAGGIHRSAGVELAAAADVSADAVAGFKAKWGSFFPAAKYYSRLDDMLGAERLDIVAVCVKGPLHYDVVARVLEAKPRAVFLEKPPTCSLEEMDRLLAASRAAGVPITVSYSRHWAPKVLMMERLVREGLIGEVRTVVAYCGGTLLSFASHTTDLICQFAGYDPAAVLARGGADAAGAAGYEPEPALESMTVLFRSGIHGMQVGRGGEHGTFYCEVFGTQGRARTGIYIEPYACDAAGKPIALEAREGFNDERGPFTVAYDQIAAALDGGDVPACTGEAFAAVHEIGFGAIESIRTGAYVALPNANRTRRVNAVG